MADTTAVVPYKARGDSLRHKWLNVSKTLKKYCVGQGDLIEGLLLATISQEHAVFIGPPGTNKSRMIDMFTYLIGANERTRLERRLAEGENISEEKIRDAAFTCCVLLNKWDTPEVLIGPINLNHYKKTNRWVRYLENTAADCDFLFIDEVFDGSGATLRSILKVLNEREIDNGGKRYKLRLISAFGATNTDPLPTVQAVYDRFMLRFDVSYIPSNDDRGFINMICSDATMKPEDLKSVLQLNEVQESYHLSRQIAFPKQMAQELYDLRSKMLSESLPEISDRRWRDSVGVLRSAAWLRGASEVEPCDFWFALRHILWSTREERSTVLGWLESYKTMTVIQKEGDLVEQATRIYEQAMNIPNASDDAETMRMSASVEILDIIEKVATVEARQKLSEMADNLEKSLTG